MLPEMVKRGIDPIRIELTHSADRILDLLPRHETRSGPPSELPTGHQALRPVGLGKVDQERTQHNFNLVVEKFYRVD